MTLEDFDYFLPPERIAQQPLRNRSQSRLLLLQAPPAPLEHRRFFDIVRLLKTGDVLVLNDTRVIPARLSGQKRAGGRVEIFIDRLLEPAGREGPFFRQRARGLVGRARVSAGEQISLPGGGRVCLLSGPGKMRDMELVTPQPVLSYLERFGQVPLPPYIRRPAAESDRRRYQTVFARQAGAVAAPTAGLHFTRPLLARLRSGGVQVCFVTLHVGAATFLPVEAQQIESQRLHQEIYRVSEDTARLINGARREGRRVVAVGTTVVRALETAAAGGRVRPGEGDTDLFIQPGFRFRVVDAMVTNFHLPRSSLLMLVAAFAGRERILDAYRQAVAAGYRFYSYGDAMFLDRHP